MNDVIVPPMLFENKNLYPAQRWLYVCLLRLCAEQEHGEYVGTYMDLIQTIHYTRGYQISVDLKALYYQGLINYWQMRKGREAVHIRISIPPAETHIHTLTVSGTIRI